MQCEQTRGIRVMQVSCDDTDRVLPPTRTAIEAMKESLRQSGQISEISVHPVTRNSYRVIAGATRLRAAAELGWKTIRASIWSGSAIDFQIHELTENVERRELTGKQRRDMRGKIKELQRQRLANVAPGKGGRGKKGGLREQAREMGVPRTTAQRRRETKVAQNIENGPVSAPPAETTKAAQPVASPSEFEKKKFTIEMTNGLFLRLVAWSEAENISVSEAIRRIIRERLDAERASPNGHGRQRDAEIGA